MELKYILAGLFVLITQISQILAADDTVKLDQEVDGQVLYNRLFVIGNKFKAFYTPERVRENLKKLVEIYKSNSFDIGEPAYSAENQKLVKDLSRTLNDEGCSKENISNFNEHLKSMSIYANINEALRFYRRSLYLRCRSEYLNSTYKAVDALKYEDKLGIMTLVNMIDSGPLATFSPSIPFYTREGFNDAVLEFLHKYPGNLAKKWADLKTLPKSDLASLYDEQIISLCSRLGEDYHREVDFLLRIIGSDRELAKIPNESARLWMVGEYACQDASRRRQEVIDAVDQLMNPINQPKKGGFFKWGRSGKNWIQILVDGG